MRRLGPKGWGWPPTATREGRPSEFRERLAVWLACAAVLCFGAAVVVSKGTRFLMPGPLASAHGGIEACSACHTKSGQGKLSWLHGLIAGDPLADSKGCLTCHRMPDTAFNAHGASAAVLKHSTERLMKIAGERRPSLSARVQDAAFPAREIMSRDLYCATCHQEHKGINSKLNEMSNAQCRACHVVKFDRFDSGHPSFESYPFVRRTRIVYDHTAHFAKHYPEVAKKEPAKQIPDTCSACHNSREDKRIMSVAPFEKACATCHLDQITGKERANGPKGIAFLALPGIDLKSLKARGAAVGEWPEESDAALTPFMKVMISRNEKGRALLKSVDGLNLQDLADASDDKVKAVTELVWEIKTLFHALIAGKASDVLGDLGIGSGAKLSAALVSDLTASIPRDVVASAQQEWLPNLATEMVSGPIADKSASPPATEAAPSAGEVSEKDADHKKEAVEVERADDAEAPKEDASADAGEKRKEAPEGKKLDRPPCLVSILGQCLVSKGEKPQPDTAKADNADGKQKQSFDQLPGRMNAGLSDVKPAGVPDNAGGKAADQADELLSPNEEELREINAREKSTGRSNAASDNSGPAAETRGKADSEAVAVQARSTAPVISIKSDVDPESWAEYGGWYRQDHAIFYRPVGHKDKFIHAWLFLSGPRAPKGATEPAVGVFDALTGKDAQGSCTKCHSIDDLAGTGRVVNFAPARFENKAGRLTRFLHEPHFTIKDDRGCLTCHSLEKDQKDRPYLKSYEGGNPQAFASNFAVVKKDLCQTCHSNGQARQDCLTCHRYHANGVETPAMTTKLPLD